MNIEKSLHPEVIDKMENDLADARDSAGAASVEVLWVGQVDSDGRVVEINAVARGSADMAPALFPHMCRGDAVIHNHPGGNLKPSDADLRVASRLGNQGIGFLIVDDAVSRVNVVAAPIPKKKSHLLDAEESIAALEPGGVLSRQLADYEPRPGQIALVREIVAAFNQNRPLIAEAGTGVGKSFAYLLPALQWAAQNEERIVISTATIALQQQLMDKDLPLVRKLLGVEVKAALVKGRGNYICLKRLKEARDGDLFFFGDEELKGLENWVESTDTGDLSDIPFHPNNAVWNLVRCEADACPGFFCPHFDACFFMKARRRAAEAGILVANHHLLFADVAARLEGAGPDEAVVLPPYHRIIVDEAHHVENSATSLFTATLSLPALNRVLNRLHRHGGASASGILTRLTQKNPALSEFFMEEIPPLINQVRSHGENLDIMGRNMVIGTAPRRLVGDPNPQEQTYLLTPLESFQTALAGLADQFAKLIRDLDGGEGKDFDSEMEGLVVEGRQTLSSLQELEGIAEAFLHRDAYPESVFWLEVFRRSDGNQWLACRQGPLSVAKLVQEAVWEPYETVIGVSATLAVGKNFQHWKSRVGAENNSRELLEGLFASPFDFASQVMLGVPTDAPLPENRPEWEAFLVHAVSAAIDLSGGHALVLFTSYETLNTTLDGVRASNRDSSSLLLAQGDDDRHRLLRKFKDHPSSVLFATDSFWEGVDVPGDALSLVIITRLPFRPPTDPVTQARGDAISAAGGNPFMQLSLPDAVIRFRQGFGRLMRRSDDRGVVLVLDPRIHRKRYGSLFLESLPPASRSIKPFAGVLRDLETFLFP